MLRARSLLVALTALAVIASSPASTASAGPATVPSDEAIMDTVEDLVGFSPRRVGSPGIDRTVDYIARRYQEYGMQRVHIEETPTYSWEALEHGLSFGGQPIDASPVIYSQSPARDHVGISSTPDGGLAAPVVDVGTGTAADIAAHDVKGKIVVFDLKFLLPVAGLLPATEFLWDPAQTMTTSPETLLTANPYITTFTEAVKAAQDGGAVGFVGVLSDYFDSNRYYNEFYRRQIVQIPGMWVTRAEGARLRERMAAEPGAQGRMVLRSERKKVPSHVVVGYLDGKSSDAIQIQSHHDSGFDGAVEDASGVAEVLALAEHYAKQPAAAREKTLMFTTFDSHWSGYSAHNAFLKRHILRRDPARDPNRIVANVTLEHIAKHALRGPNGELQVSDLPEPRGVFENLSPALKTKLIDSIVRNDLRRTAVLNGSAFQPVGIPTDASGWVMLGVPTASLISGPLYLYDAADTTDKVLKDELHEVATAFVELVDAMDETSPDAIGALPPAALGTVGEQLIGGTTIESIPASTDRVPDGGAGAEPSPTPSCRATSRGRALARVRLVKSKRRLWLTFDTRRAARVRMKAVLRDGRRRPLRTRRALACRSYKVALPRGTRHVVVRWRGGKAIVRR